MVYRDSWDNSKEIKIKRALIEVPSIKLEIKEGNIAYLKIYQFSQKASTDFSKAALEIMKDPSRKIILDLRDNPGGYLEVSQEIAGWFLEKGQIVVTEDFGRGIEKKDYKSYGNSQLLNYPMVILINKGSASASEILAAALKENRNIKLIGEKSFGKGCVQEVQEMGDGSSLKITVANWLTPKGNLIQDIGIEPDFKVEISEDDYNNGKDPQLDKAIEVLKALR
jgi:carboxyl-terminal processing protease